MKFENIRVYNFENALRGMRNPKNSWHLSDSKYGILNLKNDYEDLASDYVSYYWSTLHPEDEDLTKEYKDFELLCTNLDKSLILYTDGEYGEYAAIGPKDMKLAQLLIKSGPEHRKFLRQIMVSVDITAPLYWWKEFDTYKVGTVANSTSTMHKITSSEITMDNFECDDYHPEVVDNSEIIETFVGFLEKIRLDYLELKEKSEKTTDVEEKKIYNEQAKKVWKELIRWTPSAWNQTRTVTMNYENLLAICSKGQRRFHKLNEWSGKDDPDLTNFIDMARELPYASFFLFKDENPSLALC